MSTPHLQERFLALLEEHRRILFKVAFAYCRRPQDRQDLVQEMTVQLWRSFERYDERQRFSTWMYRVALNTAISHHRSERRRGSDIALEELPQEPAAAAATETDEELRLLHDAIARLGDLDRALLLLYLDGNRHDAIAEVLGISESNVGTRINRLKDRLRRTLAPSA